AADEEDVVVGVFTTLFEAVQRGRYPDLNDRNDLWRLLLKLTESKATDLARHERAEKRGGGLVRGLSAFAGAGGPAGLDGMPDITPTPEFIVMMTERVEHLQRLLDGDPTKNLRQVAIWKMEGYTDEEIATFLGCVPKTVERKVKTIKKLWNREEPA